MDFPQRFFETPTLITTPKHYKDDVNAVIDPDNNAITEWIEVRNLKRYRGVPLPSLKIALVL